MYTYYNNKNTKPSRTCIQNYSSGLVWNSLWDLIDPEAASFGMMELYGAMASRAATDCAAAADIDGRNEDYRFWLQVQSRVEILQKERREAAIVYWNANGLAAI